jgi:hypothetical protein
MNLHRAQITTARWKSRPTCLSQRRLCRWVVMLTAVADRCERAVSTLTRHQILSPGVTRNLTTDSNSPPKPVRLIHSRREAKRQHPFSDMQQCVVCE